MLSWIETRIAAEICLKEEDYLTKKERKVNNRRIVTISKNQKNTKSFCKSKNAVILSCSNKNHTILLNEKGLLIETQRLRQKIK